MMASVLTEGLLCVSFFPVCLALQVSETLIECRSLCPHCVLCFASPTSPLSTSLAPPPCLSLSAPGLTPALACAPSREVADCLALILATMMPFCYPCSSKPPSLGSLLRPPTHQVGKGPAGPWGPHSPRNPSGPSSEGTTENDSEDSETF